MLLKRLVLVASVVFFAFPSHAWQTSATPTQDPQAIAILQQSIKSMGGTLPADSVATGNIQTIAGSQTTQGTIRILTRGTAQSLVQVAMPSGPRTTVYSNGRANELTDTSVKVLPLELVVTSQSSYFPLPLFANLLNDPDTCFQFVGIESLNGSSVYHIQSWDSLASQPDFQTVSNFSTRDIWIDVNSELPQKISYVRRAAHGAAAGVVQDISFSDYQNFSGVLYATTIQHSMNGTPWATITIQSVSFDTGLTDANFPVE